MVQWGKRGDNAQQHRRGGNSRWFGLGLVGALSAAVLGGGCLFAFDETGNNGGSSAGPPYSWEPFDPSGLDLADQTGERICDWVEADGQCGPRPVGVSKCECPQDPDFCADDGRELNHCIELTSDQCAVSWRRCGPLFDENNQYPDQTCVENGAYGTGCYVTGTAESDGYVPFCKTGSPCENGEYTLDCIKMPQFLGWNVTVPSVGQSEYSCFEDCLHYFVIGDEVHSCGTCCSACNVSYTEWQNRCEAAAPPETTTGGGGCPAIGGYLKVGNSCCDGCVDSMVACYEANNCADAGCSTNVVDCINGCGDCVPD